jgi:hypothetical protein
MLVWWVFATSAAYVVVWLIGVAIPQVGQPGISALLAGLLVLCVALVQWMLLRWYLPGVNPWLWIWLPFLVSLAANLMSQAISSAAFNLPSLERYSGSQPEDFTPLIRVLLASFAFSAFFSILLPLLTGLIQWFALRSRVRDAYIWILARGFAGRAFFCAPLATLGLLRPVVGDPSSGAVTFGRFVSAVGSGTLEGVITGVALVWLLGRRYGQV